MNDILQLTPPPFVQRYQYKNCVQINDPVTRKRVYQTPDGESLPSVTTILSATKDMTHLNEWKKRVGVENAQRITTEAAGVGTAMHSNLERFIAGIQRQPGNNPVHVSTYTCCFCGNTLSIFHSHTFLPFIQMSQVFGG